MSTNGTTAPPSNITLLMYQKRAVQRQAFRRVLIKQLFSTNPYTSVPFDPKDAIAQQNKHNQILSDLASSFSRFAGNQKTAFDNGTVNSSAGSDASQMQQRVERALAQVLGRSYGSSPAGFVNALTSAFPTAADGQQIMTMPSKSMMSLYDHAGNGAATTNGSSTSLMGQLPARQAVLYRQANTVANDALPVLAGVMPFIPDADLEQVEALRAQVRSELLALVDEFGRIDEPRPERVRAYFDALTLHVNEFGRRMFLDKVSLIVTPQDEAQAASFTLLKNYVGILRNIWDNFYDQDRTSTFFSLSERVERANVLLPILARSNDDLEAAMDSVDFTESDRRSTAAKFTELLDGDVTIPIPYGSLKALPSGRNRIVAFAKPDITVYDLTDWLDRFANFEGPTSLARAGQYGLDFVTDQANTLFWVIAPIVTHFQATTPNLKGSSTLEQVFANERVEWSLNNLLTQLNALADLAVPGAKRNPRVR